MARILCKVLSFLLLWSVFPISLATSLTPRSPTRVCNNSPDLCTRSYSNITYLGAHDSPFLRDSSTSNSDSGNQHYNSTVQLDAGVRLLTAQVHRNNGSLDLCHTTCGLLDAGTLSNWLAEIKAWMDANPDDVVTVLLVNSENASPSELNSQFEAANITSYAYTPPSTSTAIATWPTLESLIANGTRLLTFIASLNPSTSTAAPYLMDEFTFIWENPYDVTNLANFSCVPERPPAVAGNTASAITSNRLAWMNHFLGVSEGFGILIPDISNISTTNAQSGSTGNLGATAANCTALWGKPPNYILVDFFDQGPAIATVDELNGITPVGRTGPTSSQVAGAASTAAQIAGAASTASPRPTAMSGGATRSWTWTTGAAVVLVWCWL